MQNTLSVSECVRFGWETFKKRPWFFVGAMALLIVTSFLSSVLSGAAQESNSGFFIFVAFIASTVFGVYIEMMLVTFLLKSHEGIEQIDWSELTSYLPFWKYLGAKLLASIIIVIGFILLIIPGIILALMFFAVQYLVMDKKLGPVDALKESSRITKGHKGQLLLLMLAIIGLNILGALALLIGLFVSVPVTMLAIVHAYRTLEHKASEVAPAAAIAPAVA